MGSLLDIITADRQVADVLRWPGDLELDRAEHGEPVHLASGAALEPFAGCGAGGTYFFCGDGGEERPVLYADSEGSAALIAIGLPELLRLLLVAPWWRDLREFTEAECRESAEEYLADFPDMPEQRDRAAATLALTLPAEADVVRRLREVATGAGPEFDLIFTPEGTTYDRLI